jgi:energy-coupling factor transporter ATP-binding protein EcfA2
MDDRDKIASVLRILASSVHDRTSDPNRWYPPGPAVFVSPNVRGPEGQTMVARPETLANEARVLLLGDPGAGKTTLINAVANYLAESFLADQPVLCPLLVNARDLTELRRNSWTGLVEAAGLPQRGQELETLAAEAIAHGMVHVFVDGLDEMPEPLRHQIAEELASMLAVQPRLRMLVSSRPAATPDSLTTVLSTWTLLPFSRKQAQALLSQLIGTSDGRGLLDLLTDRALAPLTGNPLILRLLVSYQTVRGLDVPQSQARMLEDLIDAILARERNKSPAPMPVEMLHRGHELVAVALTSARSSSLPTSALPRILAEDANNLFDPRYIEDFLRYALQRIVFLIMPAPDAVGFDYTFLKDFYLGRAIARDAALLERLPDTDLTQPLLLAAGLTPDPVPIVLHSYRRYGVQLAARCCMQPQQRKEPVEGALLTAVLDDLGIELVRSLRRMLGSAATAQPPTEIESDAIFEELGWLWVELPRKGASADNRGRGLERFAVALFGAFFDIVEVRDRRTIGEIDLVCENRNLDPFWIHFGGDVWVECKNTTAKTTLEQVSTFIGKLEGSRRRLGFLLSTSGFTKDAMARLRVAGSSATSPLVAPISGQDIDELLKRRLEFQRFFKDRIRHVA